jgi:hypothetical protein
MPGRYKAQCVFVPDASQNLRGYERDKIYDCEFRKIGMVDKSFYFRLWPVAGDTYYQTCSEIAFHQHFNIVG